MPVLHTNDPSAASDFITIHVAPEGLSLPAERRSSFEGFHSWEAGIRINCRFLVNTTKGDSESIRVIGSQYVKRTHLGGFLHRVGEMI